MKKYYIAILFSLILGFFCIPAHLVAQTVGNQQTISVPITASGATTEQALLSLPDDYSSTSTKYPLLVFLHGAGEAGTSLSKIYTSSGAGGPAYFIAQGTFPTSFVNPTDGQTYKYIIVSPQASGWSTSSTSLNYILNYLVSNYRVDTNRIYTTGLSAGGEGVVGQVVHIDLETGAAITPSYKVAAFVPMSAASGTPSASWGTTTVNDGVHAWGFGSPLSDIHGENTQNYINYVNAAGAGMARFTSYSGGHCCWNNFYNPTYKENIGGKSMNIYEWLLQFTRGGGSQVPTNQAPVANAGVDKSITLPTNSVTLTGSGTDTDGTISSYAWTKTAGGTATITSPSSASTNISGLAQGSYTFRLTVTDNGGATATDDVNVTVNAATQTNNPPTANAGADIAVTLPTSAAVLSGSGTDSDGTISSYAWSQQFGPNSATISSPSAATTNISNLIAGSYRFRLTVTDNAGATGYDDVNVTVSSAVSSGSTKTFFIDFGQTQTANQAGWNTMGSFGTGATMPLVDSIGAASSASLQITDGFRDENQVGTTGSSVFPPFATGDSFFIGSVGGVTDDTAAFKVSGLTNTSSYTLTFYASRVAGDGGNRTTLYTVGGTTVSLNATDNVNNVVSIPNIIPSNGAITVSVSKTSDYGYLGALKIVESGAASGNNTPTANAGVDKTITLPTTSVTLSGSGTDSDGMIASYAWTKVSGGTATIGSSSSASASVTNLSQGTYTFRLTVTDDQGATGFDDVNVTVNAAGNVAPTANAGTDKTITLPTNSVTLSGSGTDSDGTISTYAWTKTAGGAATITSPSSASTNIGGLTQGTYTFRLTVTDNFGATGFDDVNVTVNGTGVCSSATTRILTPSGGGRVLDGTTFTYNPGDTLMLQSTDAWGWLELHNFHGTANCPITVTNSGGQVLMTDNLVIQDSTYIKVAGTGAAGVQYGLKLQDPKTSPDRFAVNISGKTSHIELSNLYITNQFIGIVAENNPSCDATVNSWVMDDYSIHDNYITNMTNQGMYLGNTAPNNSATSSDPRPVVCNGATTYPTPSRMGNFKIFNNIVDGTGRPGIQLSSASTGLSEVYGNTVQNTGKNLDDAQGIGIVAGGYDEIYIHDNTVKNTYTWGIGSLGGVGVTIANNTIDKSGWVNGSTLPWGASNIFIDTRLTSPLTPTSFQIKNNVLSNPSSGTAHIKIEKSYDSYTTSGNGICSNTTATGSAAQVNVDPTITWGTTCTGTTVNSAPVVSAGTDQILPYSSTGTTLTGTATDSDGIASRSWAKTFGPTGSNPTISAPTSATTTVTGLTTGTYTFRHTATDTLGASNSADVQVTVNPNTTSCPAKKVVVIGSSTAYGTGAWPISNSWANKYTAYLQAINPSNSLVNLAVGGTTTYNGLPTGTSVPSGYPTPDTAHNISAALALNPNAIIVNYPTNDVGSGFTVAEQQANFQKIVAAATAAGVPIWVTTTQPRDDFDQNQRNILMTMRDWINTTYGTKAVDFWGTFANADGTINSLYGAGDSIHLNNAAHQILFGRVVNEGIVEAMCGAAPVNVPPTANAGTDLSITLPTSSVTLSGSGTDSDGTIASYAWTKVIGGTATITSPSTASTTVTGLIQGTYTFRLTVTDNQGATATDDILVVVNASPNNPPVVNAGADVSITLPTNSATLNGTASDLDGSIASYAWTRISGAGTISSPSSASTLVTGLTTAGTSTFHLVVTDNQGATATDDVNIIVSGAVNRPPVVSVGADKTITLPTNSLSITATASDPDNDVMTYAWAIVNGGAVTIGTPNALTTTILGLAAGTYTVRFTATDAHSLSTSDDVLITVNGAVVIPNVPPVVTVGANQTITLPTNSVTLTGSVVDSDGTIASYAWTKTAGGSATIDSSSTASTTVTGLIQGTYTFLLTATDNLGASGSGSVTVTVNPQPTSGGGSSGGGSGGGGGGSSGGGKGHGKGKPTALAGADVTIAAPIDSVVLIGSGSDADGSVTYEWTKTSGSGGTIEYPSRSTTTVKGLKKGNYTFQLTVQDADGNMATDTVAVSVLDANTTLPVTSANNTATTTTTLLNAPGQSSNTSKVRISATKLNVRSAPVSGRVIAQVQGGATGDLLSTANGWYQVQFSNGVAGWVSGLYATITNPVPVSTPQATGATGQVIAQTLNVRSAPVSGPVISKLNLGTVVTILSTSNGWSQIQIPSGGTGWVSSLYLVATSTTSSSAGQTVSTTAMTLNIRNTPGGTVVGKVPFGTQGTVISREGAWTKVQFPTMTGYVSSSYIR